MPDLAVLTRAQTCALTGLSADTLDVDPSELESAILNTVVNARDAMADGGGKLTIETSNAYLDENYCRHHAEVRPGQYVSDCHNGYRLWNASRSITTCI